MNSHKTLQDHILIVDKNKDIKKTRNHLMSAKKNFSIFWDKRMNVENQIEISKNNEISS